MPIDQLLQFVGLQCFLLATAQGQIAELSTRVAQLEADLLARPPRRPRKP